MSATAAVPTELVWHEASRMLELGWVGGRRARLTARSLREACKCSACEKRRRDGNPLTAPAQTALTQINPIGEMGVQLVFSDGHDRGIYPWPYLNELFEDLPA
ncbi:DUF971 domain-containing protein [Roseateles sp.]|uniref:DUF971 domain-containing protein n=1 Tax=Roseateles sp. TaxID=1971397 RepID=UPI003266A188